MSTENCKLCNQDSTPWVHINGHICQDCYANTKRLWSSEKLSWISVKDKLPPENTDILTHSEGGGISTALFCYRNVTREPMFILMPSCEQIRDETLVAYLKNVTHWMELPEPPND